MIKKFEMRKSRVLRKLRNGEVVFSSKSNLADPRAAEIQAMCGFDCIWTCQEHIGNDYRVINEQILAAKVYDCDTVCRVPKGCYSDYIRPLEMDATGIMVPHVMSSQEAKNIVRMTRFQPIGMRPVDGGNADGKYCAVPFKDYLQQANAERFVILQIEDPEPLEELDAVAAVEGYDMLFFGPGDFSHSIGDFGNLANPLILDARVKIAEAAKKHGKFAGTVGSLENYKELIDIGYQFINLSSDVVLLQTGFKAIMEQLSGTKTATAKGVYDK